MTSAIPWTRRFALSVVGVLAALAISMTGAGEARADDTCPGGYTCMYDGTGWGGRQYSFGDYDYNGNWRGVGAMTDQARSMWNSQGMDRCNNGVEASIFPWVYFADSGPSGKVGALFYKKETDIYKNWSSIGYYADRIDVRYNRCRTPAPSYIPRDM